MSDFLAIGATLLVFALATAYVQGCERLRKP